MRVLYNISFFSTRSPRHLSPALLGGRPRLCKTKHSELRGKGKTGTQRHLVNEAELLLGASVLATDICGHPSWPLVQHQGGDIVKVTACFVTQTRTLGLGWM